MKAVFTVIETVTHEFEVDIPDDLRDAMVDDGVDLDDQDAVQAYLRDLDNDDQLITDEMNDDTIVAVTDRSIESVKVAL